MRLMQKVINFMAVTSFVVSVGVVGGGVYVYSQRDNIAERVKERVVEAVKGVFSTSQLGRTLTGGAITDTDLDVEDNPPISLPVSPF